MKASLRGVLAAAFILGMCALCVRLGFWQLDRLAQRKARNQAWERATALAPLSFDSATAAAIARDPGAFLNRRITARGRFDSGADVVLRGRANQGDPGVHLVTPLRVEGVAPSLLVNRGWVASPDAATLDTRPFADSSLRVVTGVLQEVPRNTRGGGEPSAHQVAGRTVTAYRRLDLAVLNRTQPHPVLPLYLQVVPGPDSSAQQAPVPVPLPALDNGPHLSYAVQWFSFALIGLVGLGVMMLRGRR
jgi:surfeit locus 1 family protein